MALSQVRSEQTFQLTMLQVKSAKIFFSYCIGLHEEQNGLARNSLERHATFSPISN